MARLRWCQGCGKVIPLDVNFEQHFITCVGEATAEAIRRDPKAMAVINRFFQNVNGSSATRPTIDHRLPEPATYPDVDWPEGE